MKPDKHDIQKIGEYLVAAELHKQGIKVGIISGAAENFDLMIASPKGDFVQAEVKTRQTSRKMTILDCFTKPPDRSTFPIIFVIINIKENKEEFFIIPPDEIKKRQTTGDEDYIKKYPKWVGRYWIPKEKIREFKDKWGLLFPVREQVGKLRAG